MTIKELRERRANLISQAGEILKKAEEAKRDLTAEENTNWEKCHADADKLKEQYERMEKQEDAEKEARASQGTAAGGKQGEQKSAEQETEENRKAYGEWLRFGMAGLTPEQRAIMASRQTSLPAEARAQAIGVDTAGGYTADEYFVKKIETAMLPYAGIRNTRATIIKTASGNDMNMPTSNDTSNSGARLNENSQVTEQDIVFGSKTLRAYMYTSKMVRVSLQFLQDTDIAGIESWLAERLGERVGRITGLEFITGTGNNMPEGLANVSVEGKEAASATVIVYDELVDMEHSVNPAYRRQAEWLMGDGTLKGLKKLKDGEGRPIWVPGIAVREPDTILGYRYAIDLNIPTPASTTKSLYFGDFSKFYIRDVAQMQMLRLAERYADYLQVAFLLFSRHDSILLDAGTNPIKHLKMAT